MARRIAVTDADGTVLGHFKAPDGAPAEEIAEHHDRYRRELLAKRAVKEAELRRTEPNDREIRCVLCGDDKVPRHDLVSHVRRCAAARGIDLGDG